MRDSSSCRREGGGGRGREGEGGREGGREREREGGREGGREGER